MSVWLNPLAAAPSLCGTEGMLVSVSIHVEPRDLEEVLDALAGLDFPINPQIYHDAALIYRFADGHDEIEPTTIVEFPAYGARLPEIRKLLDARGFGSERLHVNGMLDEIHSDDVEEPAPPGAPYKVRIRSKRYKPVVASAS